MSQVKGQDKTSEKQLNEVEIGNLPEKEFRIIIVKMIQDPGILFATPWTLALQSLPSMGFSRQDY